jgi:UDP-N-acetylmuramate dehydrogenase
VITRELILQLQKIAAPGRVREKEILASHSSFRTGGPADLFIEVCDREELTKVMDLLAQSQTEVFLLGRGTNLLIGDGGYRGAVVTMCAPAGTETALNSVYVDGTILRAGAGASLLKIAMAARDAGLAGFEFAAGIPGSLGGAVMMNAGAYGGEMKQVVRSVDVLYPGKEVRTYSGEEMEFGYRTSRLKREDGIVLAAAIELAPGDKQAITDRITELAQQRKDKQPLEFASAGSTFKRPEGYFAGKLIQDAGLKGFRVGDAQVSEKHAGFVINRGNASAAEIRRLIEEVQRIVLENSGVQLEREVIFLGEF